MGGEAHTQPLLDLTHPMDGVVPDKGEDGDARHQQGRQEVGVSQMEREVQGEDTEEEVAELVEDTETLVEVEIIAYEAVFSPWEEYVVVLGWVFDEVVGQLVVMFLCHGT